MTPVDAFDVLMYLRAALPNAFLKLTEADTDAMVALWAEMFCEYPIGDVMAAAKTYVWQDTTGRFPVPGNIRQILESVQEAIDHYAYGTEYLAGDSKKFPPYVRAYIIDRAKEMYEQRTGLPFKTNAERLAEYRQQMLTGRTRA